MAKRKIKAEPKEVAVTTTGGKILNSNPGRKAIIFSNMSASDVYIRPTKAATSTLSILLEAAGGFAQVNSIEDATLPELEWFATGAGNVTILVIESKETNELEDQ